METATDKNAHAESVFIFNSCEHSLKNKGDMAMLIGIIDWLHSHYANAKLIVFSSNIAEFSALTSIRPVEIRESPEAYFSPLCKDRRISRLVSLFPGRLRAIAKGAWFTACFLLFRISGHAVIRDSRCRQFFSDMITARALVFSGGGYLNSLWWLHGLYGKAFAALVARLARVPVLLSSQGIGPIDHWMDRLVLRLLLNCATRIGVRESNTSALIAAIAPEASHKIVHTWDDALLLQADKSQISNLPVDGAPGKVLIGVNLRDSSGYSAIPHRRGMSEIAVLLDRIVERGERHLVFIPISYNPGDDDRHSAEQIVSLMRHPGRTTLLSEELPPAAIKAIIARMDAVVGVSYHFNLFALSQNVGAIGLYETPYYQHKLSGLFSIYGMEKWCVPCSGEHYGTILNKTEEMLLSASTLRSHLQAVNSTLQEKLDHSRNAVFGTVIDAEKRS